MNVRRGDVVMTRFPYASGMRGKKRPALVVQADNYNADLCFGVYLNHKIVDRDGNWGWQTRCFSGTQGSGL
ncbi:MAG: type II toxin-antitoxin system PemK/MazF family toxin [Pirellulaceae bacterium]|nr:type II toxin-antitoxin system PemK/MazF family toxin [Pirellulaceae bacterium]